VVPPGQKFDPLKIGEGPFPLPIGQKAADITKRFEVELLPPAAGLEAGADADATDKQAADKLKEFVSGSSHIRLKPRPAAADDESFTQIDLWYRRDKDGALLPRMARTVDKTKNISVVQLINVAVQKAGEPKNEGAAVPAEVLDTTVPARDSGWNVEIAPWQKPAGEATAREKPDAGDP
jgi:hypothetical protein